MVTSNSMSASTARNIFLVVLVTAREKAKNAHELTREVQMSKENTFHFYGLLIKVLNTLREVEVDIDEPVTVNWPIADHCQQSLIRCL